MFGASIQFLSVYSENMIMAILKLQTVGPKIRVN